MGHPVYCSDCLEDYVEYVGEVHQTLTLPSISECQESCIQPWQCTHWTYHKKTGQCSLLNGKTEEHHRKPNMISGTKYCDTENHVTVPANRAKGDLDLVSVIWKIFLFQSVCTTTSSIRDAFTRSSTGSELVIVRRGV